MNAKGTRGFGPDGHFELLRPQPLAAVQQAFQQLSGEDLQLEPYGQEDIRSFRVWGFVERDKAELLAMIDAFRPLGLRRFELGLRGHLRATDGRMEWMPWRKNAFLDDVFSFSGEEGVRHILSLEEDA